MAGTMIEDNPLVTVGLMNTASVHQSMEVFSSMDEFLHADTFILIHSTQVADPEFHLE